MRQLLCFKSKFPNYFALTLGRCLPFLVSGLFNVDVKYSSINLFELQLLPKMY